MADAQAVAIANEGVQLFKQGEHAKAAELFSAALEKLPAVDADVDADGDDELVQVALARARALNNRASCHLALGDPIAALDDTSDALELLCDPHRRACGVPAPRPGSSAPREHQSAHQ
jgi:tetratricopeptide (TPR) repeat protein